MLILDSFAYTDLIKFLFMLFVLGLGWGYVWRSIWQFF